MTSLWVIWLIGIAGIHANSISSPQIRIVDVTERSSETRVFPHRFEYRHPTQNTENYVGELRQGPNEQPFKSYVIYDEYPFRIFKEWKGNADYGKYKNENDDQNYFQDSRGPNPDFVSQQQQQDGHRVFTRGNPTLAYQSIYSNVIRVVENSVGNEGQELGFSEERFPQISPTLEPPFQTFYPRKPFQDEKNSVNLPPIFIPNERFQFSKFPVGPPKSSGFSPNRDFYNVGMVSVKPSYGSNQGNTGDAEGTPEIGMKNRKRLALCSYIRLNNKKFPLDGGPCGRSEDSTPLLPDEYPDHSGLSDDKLPMEHRRQQAQNKRFRRSLKRGENELKRLRRNSNFGFDSWEYPMGYGGGYNSYFNEYYSGQGGRNGYGNNNNQNRNQRGNRNRNNNNDYFDSYQSGDNSRGLSSYLSNGGRRYKNRNDNDDDNDDYRNNYDNDNGDDDYNDDNDNNNNNDYDSDDNEDNQNGRRRGSNSRRNNNEYSRNRRRNNYNNQDNDYDDNNNNNRNNRNNRNRQNNNNNNRRNNNNRNRNGYRNNNNNNNNNSGYGNSNGYNSYNGYSSYGNGNSGNGGYGSSYGNNYGSNRGYGSSGYGSSNRGYGSSGYGNSNRGYGSSGYGSYGNYGNSGNHGYGSGGYGSGGGFGFF